MACAHRSRAWNRIAAAPPLSLAVKFAAAVLASVVSATAVAQVVVPPELAAWEGWVLQGREQRRCPFLINPGLISAGATNGVEPGGALIDDRAYRCAWPGPLQLAVDATGGHFTQSWRVFSESWVTLPGSLLQWPRDVRLGSAVAAVVEREGRPQLRLAAGAHVVSGRFAWSTRPESLPIAAQTGIVELSVEGQRVAQPERPAGSVWLGKRRTAEEAAGLEVQVYRLLQDDIPAFLTTRIRLQVAGEGREELLAAPLPAGFTPLSLSGGLPARVDADGRLRVQVRPGSHELVLAARAAGIATQISRAEARTDAGAWPRAEVWSFQGNDRLRVVVTSGAEAIDPAQADVPGEWRQLPAFRVVAGTTLRFEQTSRGLAASDDNRLRLVRRLWLDFDHGGFTALDSLSGTLRKDWRLGMLAPFRLESARSGEQDLLVTERGDAGRRGVELRTPNLALQALARFESVRGAQPATGWDTRFESVRGELNLPPGHRLLAAIGPDAAPGTWWSGWGLWSVFGVVIVVVLTYRLVGRVPAAVAFGALVLMSQESPTQIWLWTNLLLAIGLASVLPEGRLAKFVRNYQLASLLLLGLSLLPFLGTQLRLAIHPQLDAGTWVVGERSLGTTAGAPAAVALDEVASTQVAAEMRDAGEAMNATGSDAEGKVNEDGPQNTPAQSSVPATKVRGYGLNQVQVIQRYAPGTALQAGPGIPQWRYIAYAYSWSGPVELRDSVRFVFIGPAWLALWRVFGVVLLTLWFVALLQRSMGRGWPALKLGLLARVASGSSAAVLAWVLLGGAAVPVPARAASTPDAALLQELATRLTAAPRCAPSCATLTAARVSITRERLVVELDASALATLAIPVPHANDRWQLDELTVDGQRSLSVAREGDGSLWVPLSPGTHRIRLAGPVAPVATLQLVFPEPPRVVSVNQEGWDAAGVNDARLLAGAIEFTRRRSARAEGGGAALDTGAEFPAFVRVLRDFNLDLDWSVITTVQRVAPERAALTVEVPLLRGESVLTPGFEVRDRTRVLAGLAAGQNSVSWSSGLARASALTLNMAKDVARTEIWRFSVNPQWHVSFAGLPATLPDELQGPLWVYQYFPRAGETLELTITRPTSTAGKTLAIDRVQHDTRLGSRSSDVSLRFSYRSTQGGRHGIVLPKDASVRAVTLDGQPVQIRPEQGLLSINLLPGQHSVAVDWQSPRGAAAAARPDIVDLGSAASNITTRLALPADRWPLLALARDAGVGPAVLYWGELLVFLVVAVLLRRSRVSPVRGADWLLLGLGLSTLSWLVFALMALWFFAIRWRERWPARVPQRTFNAVQLLLALLTVGAIASLVFSGVRYGFFSTPDMGVVGGESSGADFVWFRDHSARALPQPLVMSVPLWVYKALIFGWALWLASALMRWLKWAWSAWTHEGYWRSAAPVVA